MPCAGKPAKADLAKYPQQQAVAPVEPETPDPKARLATGSCHESFFEIRVLAGEAAYKDVVFPTPASYPAEWGLGLVIGKGSGPLQLPSRLCETRGDT